MTEKSEWQFLVDYVKDDTTDFRNAVCRSQLMALWTAYCMHNDLYCSAVSWTMMTPAICVMMSEITWSRSWSKSSHVGSTA